MADTTTPSQQGSTSPSHVQDGTSARPAPPAGATTPTSEAAPKKRMKLADYTAKKIARAAALARGEDVKPLLPVKNENYKRPLDEEERVTAEPVFSKRVAGFEATPSKSEEAPAASQAPSDAAQAPSAITQVQENKVIAQINLAQLALDFETSPAIQVAAPTTTAPANTITEVTATTIIEASANTATTASATTTIEASATTTTPAPATTTEAPAPSKTSSAANKASTASKTQEATKPAVADKIPAANKKKAPAPSRISSTESKIPAAKKPAVAKKPRAPRAPKQAPPPNDVSAPRKVAPRKAPAPSREDSGPRRVTKVADSLDDPTLKFKARFEELKKLHTENEAKALADKATRKAKVLADKTNTTAAAKKRRAAADFDNAPAPQKRRLSGKKTEREDAPEENKAAPKPARKAKKVVPAQALFSDSSDENAPEENKAAPKPTRKARKAKKPVFWKASNDGEKSELETVTKKDYAALEEKREGEGAEEEGRLGSRN